MLRAILPSNSQESKTGDLISDYLLNSTISSILQAFMRKVGGERFFGSILSRLPESWQSRLRRRGSNASGKSATNEAILPVAEKPNTFCQAIVLYLADRQRLRQQGYLQATYGEPTNISLADAYHNDLTALAFAATDDTSSAQEVREAGNVSGVRDHFELFAFARFSPQKEVEIVTRKARELEQHERERSSKAQDKVRYTGEELATVAMLLEKIGFRFDYPENGYELTRSEVDAAWKAVIGKWQERTIQATKDIGRDSTSS